MLTQVRDAFNQIGDATPIMVGGNYLEWFGAGSGPKVLFVPEAPGAGGKMAGAGASRLGDTAAQIHGCNVYVRAPERSTDDIARFDDLYALNDFVVDLVSTAGSGRLTWGACSDDSPLRVPSGLGCALAWSFTYTRAIRHDARRWANAPRDEYGIVLAGPLTTPVDDMPPVLSTSPGAVVGTVVSITIPVPVVE